MTGFVNGGTQIYAAKDDAFKNYYGNLYDSSSSVTTETLSAGTPIAAGREDDLRALTSLLGGNLKAAEDYQAAMVEIGRTPPFSYETAVTLSREMLGLGLSAEQAMDRINGLADTAAALALSDSNVKSIVSFLESAQLSGTVDARVVKSLSKMGVNVYGALAEEFGIDESEVLGQLKEMDADRAIEAIYSYMETAFPDAANSMSSSTKGLTGILDSWKESISTAGGEAYNENRKDALTADVAAYSGPLGDKLAELSAIAGEVQAYGDNLRDQFQREALSAVVLGDLDKKTTVFSDEDAGKLEDLAAEFAEAQESYNSGSLEAGQKMIDLREEAESLATAAYESSEWAQSLHEAELEQITATRELTSGLASATQALEISTARSIGMAATAAFWGESTDSSGPYSRAPIQESDDLNMRKLKSLGLYAYGLDYVPYDEFPALLHQGERVLTAEEAREMDRGVLAGAEQLGADKTRGLEDWAEGRFAFGLSTAPYENFPALLHQGERVLPQESRNGSVNITVNVGEMHVRQESDIDAIAEALAERIQTAMLRGGG